MSSRVGSEAFRTGPFAAAAGAGAAGRAALGLGDDRLRRTGAEYGMAADAGGCGACCWARMPTVERHGTSEDEQHGQRGHGDTADASAVLLVLIIS